MSLETFEFDNGVRVTVDYDEWANCPLEGRGTWSQGVGICQNERNSTPSDLEGVLKDVEQLRENIENMADDLGRNVSQLADEYGADWWVRVDEDNYLLIEAVGYVEELFDMSDELGAYVVFEYTDYSGYGHPTFTVAGDRKLMAEIGGFSPDDTKTCTNYMRGVAGVYAH